MNNPFSDKAGVKKKSNPFTAGKPKTNPFSPNGEPTQDEIRNRMTGKDRAKALRAADKANKGPQVIQNPKNPWVAQAHDIAAKVADIDAHLVTAQKDYSKSLKAANRAKTLEDINAAFDISDRMMNVVLGYCAQRKRLMA